jgi:hypothetical protein
METHAIIIQSRELMKGETEWKQQHNEKLYKIEKALNWLTH